MNKCYASICGTAVIQLKDVPPRPAEYDGRVTIFDLGPASADEEAVRTDLARFGNVVEFAVVTGVATIRPDDDRRDALTRTQATSRRSRE